MTTPTTDIAPADATRLVPAVPASPSDAPGLVGGQGALVPRRRPGPGAARRRGTGPAVDVVVPVHQEAHVLREQVRRLHEHLSTELPFTWRITIADNGSTDGTDEVARDLERGLPHVRALRLEEAGRGRALRAAWSASDAEVVAYTDVDLSTDLRALLPLVAPLLSGHSELAVGTRLAHGSSVVRGRRREILSRGYNRVLRVALRARFSDAQCGFKAGRASVVRRLLPEVRDEEWFFDTELLVLAQRRGLRIHEVPVDWTDDPDSRVRILRTIRQDLRGVARLLVRRDAGRRATTAALAAVGTTAGPGSGPGDLHAAS